MRIRTWLLSSGWLVVTLLPGQEPARKPRSLTPEMLPLAAAYCAKVTASALFVSGRSLASVHEEELAPDSPLEAAVRLLLKLEVDAATKTVTAQLGKFRATAVSTANLGCTLVFAGDAQQLRQRAAPGLAALRADDRALPFPQGERVEPTAGLGINHAALQAAVDAAFAKPARRTRAVVVTWRGKIIAERYAAGFHQAMPLPGWSMSKTLFGALLGCAVADGKLRRDGTLACAPWPKDDPRRAITLDHLLTMTSGLRWQERTEEPTAALLTMLFGSGDHGVALLQQPLAHGIGGQFAYCSGATNTLSRELRAAMHNDLDYWAMPQARLFGPLSMRSAVLETDQSGTLVGSSYGFATARDWARFGIMLGNEGRCGETQVVPKEWIEWMRTPSPASAGRYGRHLWLNHDPDGDGPQTRPVESLPEDTMRMLGFQGQAVVIVPSAQLVVVRLGCTKQGPTGSSELAAAALACLP